MGINHGGPTPFHDGADESDDLPYAPAPPHERTWRHPSELGYADFKSLPPPDIGRTGRGLVVFTILSGFVLLIGLLIIVRPGDGRRNTDDIVRLASANLSVATINMRTGSTTAASPMAVRIDGTPYLLTTRQALVSHAAGESSTVDEITVRLANGDSASAHVVLHDERVAILSLESGAIITEISVPMAIEVSSGQVVTVALSSFGSSFIVDGYEISENKTDTAQSSLVLRQVDDESVDETVIEGAPVVDQTGRFIGLLSISAGKVILIPVTSAAELIRTAVTGDDGNDGTRSDQSAATTPAP